MSSSSKSQENKSDAWLSMKNFINNDNDKSVQDVLARLRFIARLQIGQKIDTVAMCVIPDTYYYRFCRTFLARGETREKTLRYVRQALSDAYALLAMYHRKDDALSAGIAKEIKTTITASKDGISSLAQTYKDDHMFVSHLETLLSMVDLQISSIEKA